MANQTKFLHQECRKLDAEAQIDPKNIFISYSF